MRKMAADDLKVRLRMGCRGEVASLSEGNGQVAGRFCEMDVMG